MSQNVRYRRSAWSRESCRRLTQHVCIRLYVLNYLVVARTKFSTTAVLNLVQISTAVNLVLGFSKTAFLTWVVFLLTRAGRFYYV
jgi:hypothetical protein